MEECVPLASHVEMRYIREIERLERRLEDAQEVTPAMVRAFIQATMRHIPFHSSDPAIEEGIKAALREKYRG